MKKILSALVIAFGLSISALHAGVTPTAEGARYIDGNWFQLASFTSSNESKYGSTGDATISGVLDQLDSYSKAKTKAEADPSDITSREACENLAVRSSVRGQYALEVGRLYLKAGDVEKGKAAYQRAKAWGEAAQKASYETDSEEENTKVIDNQKTGAWVVTVANRQLSKIK